MRLSNSSGLDKLDQRRGCLLMPLIVLAAACHHARPQTLIGPVEIRPLATGPLVGSPPLWLCRGCSLTCFVD